MRSMIGNQGSQLGTGKVSPGRTGLVTHEEREELIDRYTDGEELEENVQEGDEEIEEIVEKVSSREGSDLATRQTIQK